MNFASEDDVVTNLERTTDKGNSKMIPNQADMHATTRCEMAVVYRNMIESKM